MKYNVYMLIYIDNWLEIKPINVFNLVFYYFNYNVDIIAYQVFAIYFIRLKSMVLVGD